jgi:hypothetical protein
MFVSEPYMIPPNSETASNQSHLQAQFVFNRSDLHISTVVWRVCRELDCITVTLFCHRKYILSFPNCKDSLRHSEESSLTHIMYIVCTLNRAFELSCISDTCWWFCLAERRAALKCGERRICRALCCCSWNVNVLIAQIPSSDRHYHIKGSYACTQLTWRPL